MGDFFSLGVGETMHFRKASFRSGFIFIEGVEARLQGGGGGFCWFMVCLKKNPEADSEQIRRHRWCWIRHVQQGRKTQYNLSI